MNEGLLKHAKLYKSNQELSCKEKGKSVHLKTKEAGFYKIKIDDIKHIMDKKCDFLIIKEELDIWIYVELKGNKIQEAYKQLEAIRNKYKNNEQNKTKYYFCLVFSRHPQETTSIQKLKTELSKNNGKIFSHKKLIHLEYNSADNSIKKLN